MMVRVVLTPQAAEDLDSLPRPIQARIARLLRRLEAWPVVSGVKPLTGRLAGHYRVRTGDYRLQFIVAADTLRVEKIGHRDRFYED
ncbi:MAG: type II toxin-antitoxin system RelE family toxin [Pirellulales bacterium]